VSGAIVLAGHETIAPRKRAVRRDERAGRDDAFPSECRRVQKREQKREREREREREKMRERELSQ